MARTTTAATIAKPPMTATIKAAADFFLFLQNELTSVLDDRPPTSERPTAPDVNVSSARSPSLVEARSDRRRVMPPSARKPRLSVSA